MNYSKYKRINPEDVLVYIEEYNKENGTIVFDFFDSNEYALFTEYLNVPMNLDKPSMVILNDYKLKKIQENTIYSINKTTIQGWKEEGLVEIESNNSLLIGYTVNISQSEKQVFISSVTLDDFEDQKLLYYMNSSGDIKNIPIKFQGKYGVVIRKVEQGNWNEIHVNNKCKIVYDAGTSINASYLDIQRIIGNKIQEYSKSNPGLILSHWDKDHYHCLLGMSNNDLKVFSFFVCRHFVPNLTCRLLFNRISTAVGSNNTYSLPNAIRTNKSRRIRFFPITPTSNQLVIYNAQYHKDRNKSGIVLSLKTSASSIILSGDAHYKQISDDILPSLNYIHKHNLVVPHHGGKAGSYIYNLPNSVIPNIAIISTGKNQYGHPLLNITRSLRLQWFNLRRTDLSFYDIIINL